jgi:hypothetical protein
MEPSKAGSVVLIMGFEFLWNQPDNHSSTIDKYEILFMLANGDFAPELTRCDGALPAFVTARKCSLPMATLRTLTTLQWTDLEAQGTQLQPKLTSIIGPRRYFWMFMEVFLTYRGPSRQLSGVNLNLVLHESEE